MNLAMNSREFSRVREIGSQEREGSEIGEREKIEKEFKNEFDSKFNMPLIQFEQSFI